MADITKCQGRNCERKETCYRYTAQADDWQSWSDFDKLEDCEYYWKIESEEKQQYFNPRTRTGCDMLNN